jgi:dTMP kinase
MEPMKQLRRGILVALEGIDGCGKSTLAKKLEHALRDYAVTLSREPGGTPIGAHIRELLLSDVQKSPETEFLLFAADRAEHMRQVIRPARDAGHIVISDRMATSSVAYQGYGKGASIDHIHTVNDWAMAGCKPDLIIYLALDFVTAYQRVMSRSGDITSFEKEQADFFERVIHGFEKTCADASHVKKIDATQSVDAVAGEALQAVMEVIHHAD